MSRSAAHQSERSTALTPSPQVRGWAGVPARSALRGDAMALFAWHYRESDWSCIGRWPSVSAYTRELLRVRRSPLQNLHVATLVMYAEGKHASA